MGWGGDTEIAESILNGTANIADLTSDKYAQAILLECARINDETDPSISVEDFKKFYLHWRVGTSTPPSGRHLSHLHALCQPVGLETDSHDDTAAFAETKHCLWTAHHACVQYALRFGHSFSRWRQVVNTMIEKEPGRPMLHQLCVIHLYENDYNLILGTKFRQVIQKCQDMRQINPGCYGGILTKQSLDPIFLEMMQHDYAQLSRHDAIKFANDAGSCYDRIIVPPSSVIARSRGLHANVAKIHGITLQNGVYRIKTQLGVSTQTYSHSAEHPVFGTGQGSTGSPPTWTLNGSLYFDLYDKLCDGAEY